MKKAYPIIITHDKNMYVVSVPDFEANTQGETIAEAMEMARDLIGMCGCFKEDEHQPIPEPSNIEKVKATATSEDTVTLVDVDFTDYRRKHDMRTIRRNVSIPYYLDTAAKQAGINVSAVLQEALKRELHIQL